MDITYLTDTCDTGYVEDVELNEPVDTEIMSDLYEYLKLEKHSASEIIQLCQEIDLISASLKKCQNINEKHTTAGRHVFCHIRHNI